MILEKKVYNNSTFTNVLEMTDLIQYICKDAMQCRPWALRTNDYAWSAVFLIKKIKDNFLCKKPKKYRNAACSSTFNVIILCLIYRECIYFCRVWCFFRVLNLPSYDQKTLFF